MTGTTSLASLIDGGDRERLFAHVGEHVRRQPQAWSEHHGFHLVFGDLVDTLSARTLQARRVLVAEHLLAEVGRLAPGSVLMKGLEVAALYPTRVSRPFRDLDLLVADARPLWDVLVERGHRSNPSRRLDLDHHHLPALAEPTGTVGVEVHTRPNVPTWSPLSAETVFASRLASRTGVSGIDRPSDDVHALLLAHHCWSGGFTRLRDLLDAVLLATVSEAPVKRVAAELGLTRFWAWTVRFAGATLLGEQTRSTSLALRVVMPPALGIAGRRRSRLASAYLVAPPIRVTRSHFADLRLGLQARRAPVRHGR